MSTSLTEQCIRLAATRLISRIGYESMSLRQLTSEAGINSSTLYLYYKGKRELLLTLVLEYFQELSLAWDDCRPRRARAETQLRAFIAFHLRHHLLRREQAVLGNMELRSLETSELMMVKQARRAYLGKLQEILEQGCAEGSLHCDEPKLLARIICSMLTHTSTWYQAEGRLGVDEMISHYTGLIMHMLSGGTPRRPPASRKHQSQEPR